MMTVGISQYLWNAPDGTRTLQWDSLPLSATLTCGKPQGKQLWDKSWQAENGHGSATDSGDQITASVRRALYWNPQASRLRGRSRNNWRRDTDHAIQSRGLSCHQLERLSRDKGDWRDFVSSLCSEMEKLKASDQIRSDQCTATETSHVHLSFVQIFFYADFYTLIQVSWVFLKLHLIPDTY